MFLRNIFLISILLFSTYTEALVITSGRGEVTIIKNDLVQKIDTSEMSGPIEVTSSSLVITSNNSYARIVNDRGDILILAPESKMTVELTNDRYGDFFSLHDGLLRIIAKKQRKVADNHYDRIYVRTNSAIFGVEDGDALLSYNLFNNVSGLISFRGESRLKRIDRSAKFSAGRRLTYRRSVRERKLNYKFMNDDSVRTHTTLINELLFGNRLKDVSLVERGQYSATFHDARPVSIPVKINPIQFTLLYRNTYVDMTRYDQGGDDETATVASYPLKGEIIAPKDQEALYRGQYSEAQKKYAPKAGGLVDIRTGIYIPPEDSAIFNEVYKVYVPKEIGRINAANGNFIPPKNLRIDPNRGFVVVNNTHESLENSQKLNNLLKSNLLLASFKNAQRNKMTTAERFSANIIGLSLVDQSYTHSYNNADYSFSKRGLEFDIILIGNGSFRPFAKFRLLNENFELTSLSNEVERFYQMNLGLDFHFGGAFYASTQIAIDEEPIVLTADNRITSATLTNFIGEVGFRLIDLKRFTLFIHGGLKYNMTNEDDQYNIESGVGFYFGAKADYWLNRRSFLYGEFSYLNHSYSIISTTATNSSDVDMSGAIVNFGYRYSF